MEAERLEAEALEALERAEAGGGDRLPRPCGEDHGEGDEDLSILFCGLEGGGKVKNVYIGSPGR